jgi:hypothetical protein
MGVAAVVVSVEHVEDVRLTLKLPVCPELGFGPVELAEAKLPSNGLG